MSGDSAQTSRVVHVEDSPDDAELVQRALRVGGFAATLTRVETEAELVAVLRSGPPDVILSDYSLPRFSGLDVLRLTRLFSPETPVIVVSGTIGEDRAAEILREGAIDYVLKDRLARLVPAVERALREAEERRVRQRLEEQLFQAQKMEALGRLAGGVAHDFNNLLTVILGYGSLVAGQVARDPDAARNLEQMLLAGERAAGLTRQLLSFSRKQVGQPRLIDVNIVVQEIERMLRRLIGEDIDLHSVLAPDLWRVLADMGQIEQVIVNLAVNARDAMPEGGKLTIETANVDLGAEYAAVHAEVQPGQYVLLAVTDTGTGMDAETQRRIFEPFFTTKEPGKGTGLGLATCYAIVRQSGGHLWVYSEPGRGASFKVYLPRAEGGPAVAVDGPAPPPAGGAETILLVEDDETVCFLARTVLEGRGYHVLAAPDSATALELVAAHAEGIALLVADLVMPGLSGPDLARRAAERIPGLRVLLMSGYAADAVVRHGVLAPGAAFLQKPFTPDALARKVREMLDG